MEQAHLRGLGQGDDEVKINSTYEWGTLSSTTNQPQFNPMKKTSSKSNRTCSKKISAASYMRRIRVAQTSSAVSSVISTARNDANFIRNSGASSEEIKMALRIVEKAVEKAKIKMTKLKQEQQLMAQKELTKGINKLKLQRQLRQQKKAREAIERVDELDPRVVTITRKNEFDDHPLGILTNNDSESMGSSIDVQNDCMEVPMAIPGTIDIQV